MPFHAPDDAYQHAKVLIGGGKYREALPLLIPLRQVESYRLKANTNIGGCLIQMGHLRAGLKFTNRALALDPIFTPALINQAEAYLAFGNVDAALEIYSRLAVHDCGNWLWRLGHSKALHAVKQDSEALDAVETYLSYYHDSIPALILKGEIQSDLGSNLEAVHTFGLALALNPKDARIYSHLSAVMMRQNQMESALRYLDKALEIKNDSLSELRRKGLILYSLSRVQEASIVFSEAFLISNNSASCFLSQYLLIPSIASDVHQIEESRAKFLRGLELAEKKTGLVFDPENESIPHLFFLAYHNRDDREIIERYMVLMRKLAQPFLPESGASTRDTKCSGRKTKIRIGFLSSFFSSHSNCFAFEGLIKHLERSLFEVSIIHTSLSKKDACRDRLDAMSDQVITLANNIAEIHNSLCSAELDILYFTDLGMNAYDFLIPMLRTASIQLTGWGIPHTSGLSEIDYYISFKGIEPENAEKHYTEKLILLPVGVPCCFLDESLHLAKVPREYFVLPPEGKLVGCLQALHKLHPDFDFVLEEIAQQNPEVGFIFVEDALSSRTERFIARLAKNAPTVSKNLVTLALMNRAEYHSLCNCMDLLLDPIYYGSGITFFEASFTGTPIVTLEGEYLRSRTVSSGYREMGLSDLPIAHSFKEYIHIATDLLTNDQRRSSLRSEIVAKKAKVFNRIDFVRSFEAVCIDLVDRHCKSL